MKRLFRKTFCLVLVMLMCVSMFSAVCVMATNNRVYSNQIKASPGDTVKIPVMISNSTGLMGFSIILTYDKDAFTPVSVEKGGLIGSGLFDDSIGTTDDNSFKVVWSGTSAIKADGELFVASLKVNSSAKGDYKIKITYERHNTFDENFKEVDLSCEDINVQVKTEEPSKLTLWQIITKPFVIIWNWIKSIFKR